MKLLDMWRDWRSDQDQQEETTKKLNDVADRLEDVTRKLEAEVVELREVIK